MIQVNCPSCQASYDVDERRLPADGLKMRCPQCGESFRVQPDGSILSSDDEPTSPKSSLPPKQRKMTQVGLGPNVPAPASNTARSLSPEEIDLPAPISSSGLEDLPAPRGGVGSLDLDPFEDVSGGADLPAPKAKGQESSPSGFDPFADIDLPAPMEPSSSVDLPAPLGMDPAGGVDLPAPRGAGSADLPAPKGARRFADEVDLPMAVTDAELPAPIGLDSELPVPIDQGDLPVPLDDFSDPPLEGPGRRHGGGPVELDLPDGEDLSLEMDIDPGVNRPAPPPVPGLGAAPPLPASTPDVDPAGAPPTSPSVPSVDRVSRDSAELDLPVSDDLEFSELPSAEEDEVERMPHPGGKPAPAAPRARKRTIDIRATLSKKRPPWLMKAVAGLSVAALILGGGFYLGGTKYGLFGVHLVEPFLPQSGDVVEVTQAIQVAENGAASDTYEATAAALAQLEQTRNGARLNRALVARSLLHESYFQLRFGQDPQSAARADELRLHLQRRGDEAPGVHTALAANALRQADGALAASELALAQAEDPTDPYVDLLAGEAALIAGDGKTSVEAFGRAFQKDGSARAKWGVARAERLLGNRDNTMVAARETHALSPDHAGARVALAESLIADGDLDGAQALLQAPAGLAPGAGGTTSAVSRSDRSAALSLVARIEESRGRLGVARELYEKAVELDAGNSWAALGAARLVLLEGGYAGALARFQTVLGAQLPAGAELDATGQPKIMVHAKLGAAEALVAMDKASDAKTLLADLRTEEPVNAEVEIWQGKVAAALGDSREAVNHLRNAIELEPTSFHAYMALAQHYKATKRPGEAVGVLVEAQDNVEITAEVRRLLGDAELERNRIDEAIKQYKAALEMEPRDSSAQFGLAIAYRRKVALEDAAAALDKVAELDASFPGLALERGRLAEAGGDLEGAATRYREALAQTPGDVALRSRLGAVLVSTGQYEEARKILEAVLAEQPYSAESEHYLGRIDLEQGDLVGARQHFVQASRLEPQSGLYRMYVAWAALNANEMTTALRELEATLKLDPSLGDAYWLRARIRIRAGQVRDALEDLRRAIQLSPGRTEAWAAIGEAHYQLGQMNDAIAAFQTALEADPQQGYWWYRLGRLQLDVGKRDAAVESLTTSAELGDALAERPGWLADAHRLLGDVYYAQRKNREAVVEYGRYLELSPANAIDRADVQAKLRKIGAVAR